VSRRSAALVAVAVVAVLVGVGLVGYAVIGGGDATPTAALAAPRFVDETATAGIDHTYAGDPTFFDGGGVAVLDCNDDGRPDLFAAGGSGPAALYRNDSPVGGALRFTRLPDPGTDLTGVTGAYPVDIDGDGNVDLVVLRAGENVLLRGLGGCRFERANEAWGYDGGDSLTMAFSATWEDPGTLPTLAFGNYLKLDATGKSTFDCDQNALLRPNAAGTGYGPPIALTPGYCALSILFSSWDRSGRRDLRISNDSHYYDPANGEEQLWRVAPGEAPQPYTAADGWVMLQIEGMGIASYDLTGDGYPEVFLTSQADNKLQTLTAGPAQPTYRDIALKRGVTAARPFAGGDVLPSTAWHPQFEDVNDDGFVDLFISKGNVSAEQGFATKDPSDLFLGQPDGTFREAADAAGILEYVPGRGAALADFNLDGMLDLAEVKFGAPMRIWRNVGSGDAGRPAPMGNWLAVTLRQPGANRDAIGAWLEVQVGQSTLRRELTVGGGHVSGQLGPLHFGLGSATGARVRVQWPDGEQGPWIDVKANESVTVDRAAGGATPLPSPTG
jgi:hypothetical protein